MYLSKRDRRCLTRTAGAGPAHVSTSCRDWRQAHDRYRMAQVKLAAAFTSPLPL
jgi:hypothetical protein